MDLRDLQDFIKTIAKSGATEIELETGDLKLKIKTPPRGKTGPDTIVQQIQVPSHQFASVPQVPMPHATAPTTVVNSGGSVDVPREVEASKGGEEVSYIEVKAPMVGTFYRRPSPDKPAFANAGDEIETGQVICIIEAMKLFNEIESEVSGKVVKVLVEDGTPVEYDQTLLLVEPA